MTMNLIKDTMGILFFMLLSNLIFGQVEGWLNDLETANDKTKVDIYNKVAEYYTNDSEPFSAKNYAKKSIDLADEIDYQDGLAVGYFLLAEAYNLESDLNNAEKHYKKWYKTRKKYGTDSQLDWAIMGMGQFYQSQERDWKTERFYKKILKKTTSGSRKEFSILRVIAQYYQHGANFRTDRKLNLKKGTKYFELLTESGQNLFGADYGTGDMDNYFSTELVETLDKKQLSTANKIADQWLISKAKFAEEAQMYRTYRLITRYFFDNSVYEPIPTHLNLSIASIKKFGNEHRIQRAYHNAIYVARSSKKHKDAINYCFGLYEYEKDSYEITSALNACVAAMIQENDSTLNQAIINQILDWKNSLNLEQDKTLIEWANKNIEYLGTVFE